MVETIFGVIALAKIVKGMMNTLDTDDNSNGPETPAPEYWNDANESLSTASYADRQTRIDPE